MNNTFDRIKFSDPEDVQISPYEQLWFTTQDIEKMYFYGDFSPECYEKQIDLSTIMLAGEYRVIDGELFKVMPGVPPEYNNIKV